MGVDGVVVDVKVASRRDKATDKASKSALTAEVNKVKRQYQEKINEVRDTFVELVRDDIIGMKMLIDVVNHKTEELVLQKGKRIKVSHLENAD